MPKKITLPHLLILIVSLSGCDGEAAQTADAPDTSLRDASISANDASIHDEDAVLRCGDIPFDVLALCESKSQFECIDMRPTRSACVDGDNAVTLFKCEEVGSPPVEYYPVCNFDQLSDDCNIKLLEIFPNIEVVSYDIPSSQGVCKSENPHHWDIKSINGHNSQIYLHIDPVCHRNNSILKFEASLSECSIRFTSQLLDDSDDSRSIRYHSELEIFGDLDQGVMRGQYSYEDYNECESRGDVNVAVKVLTNPDGDECGEDMTNLDGICMISSVGECFFFENRCLGSAHGYASCVEGERVVINKGVTCISDLKSTGSVQPSNNCDPVGEWRLRLQPNGEVSSDHPCILQADPPIDGDIIHLSFSEYGNLVINNVDLESNWHLDAESCVLSKMFVDNLGELCEESSSGYRSWLQVDFNQDPPAGFFRFYNQQTNQCDGQDGLISLTLERVD